MFTSMATTPTKPIAVQHHGQKSWTSYWRDDQKKLRTKRFGKERELSQRDANARYDHWYQTEWLTKPWIRNPDAPPAVYLVRHLAEEYRSYAEVTFLKHGRQTTHVGEVCYAMDALAAF